MWGGNKLKQLYGFDSSEHCGEVWGISAYQEHPSTVLDGKFKGLTLKELYTQEKALFGNYPSAEFPLLVKVIDAQTDLSVQVHPSDSYARQNYQAHGKTECWYILETAEDTNIIIGHKAKKKKALIKAVNEKKYESILNKFPIKKGEMYKIPAGTIHAICAGTVLLEVQQPSDLTFRFYDYDRLVDGKPRELHVQEALEVVKVPDKILEKNGTTDYFTFKIIDNQSSQSYFANLFGDYLFIIDGSGSINSEPVNKGDFIFITSNEQYEITGEIKFALIKIK